MRSYSNLKHVFRSIEDGAPQVALAFSSPSRSIASCSQTRPVLTTTRHTHASYIRQGNLAVTLCESRSKSNRVRPLGNNAFSYSTAREEADQSRDVDLVAKSSLENATLQAGEETDISRSADTLIPDGATPSSTVDDAENSRPKRKVLHGHSALPRRYDYDGFGRKLCTTPKQSLHGYFERKHHLISLSSRFIQFVGRHKHPISCSVECKIQHTGEIIATHATGSSKDVAEAKAYRVLVSNLHVSGLLQQLKDIRDELGPYKLRESQFLDLPLDDDMLIVMRRSLQDLRTVGEFPVPEMNERQFKHAAAIDIWSDHQYRSAKSLEMASKFRDYLEDPSMGKLRRQNENLPVNQMKAEILGLVENNTYSIILADTSSGKSSQVPQILLDNAIMNGFGAESKILCIQPRRIAASSLARRVASERDEPIGQSVGYRARFDSLPPKEHGTITYCTTGVMVNLLRQAPDSLGSISHIILDEVHERSIDIDFLMVLLRNIIDQRQANGLHAPKIVLMSATLDVNHFASYFQNMTSDGWLPSWLPAPHLYIPGRPFAVDKHYLRDVLDSLSQTYPEEALSSLLHEPQTNMYLRRYSTPYAKLFKSEEKDTAEAEHSSNLPLSQSARITSHEEEPLVPTGLVSATICHTLSTTKEGAILVFLPGLRNIIDVEKSLRLHGEALGCNFSDEYRYKILQLHSQLPDSQTELLEPVPPGCRRIILSTDVAETSITIPDDVNFVIDTGKVHQAMYDSQSKSRRLASCWISQASVSQRAGRAGRIRNGEYFALFTEEMEGQFSATRSPEMVRGGLQATCLRAKRIVSDTSIRDLLRQCIDPPKDDQLDGAIKDLQSLKALDQHEELTPLGSLLSELPLDPYLGKLVLLGIIFRCLDPLLILATFKIDMSLFHLSSTHEAQEEVHRSRETFSQNTWSDHLSVINAFKAVREVLAQEGHAKAARFAEEHRINLAQVLEGLREAEVILQILARKGLIPAAEKLGDNFQFGGSNLNTNSWRIPVVKAMLLYIMYPNIAVPLPLQGKAYRVEKGAKVHMSATSTVNYPQCPRALFIYNHKRYDLYDYDAVLQHTTHVTPLTTCLLGGRLQGSDANLRMDSWFGFKVKNEESMKDDQAARVLIEFRKALDMAFTGAFNALTTIPTHALSTDTADSSNVSPELVFNTVSDILVDILDRDVDPVYAKRGNTETQWT